MTHESIPSPTSPQNGANQVLHELESYAAFERWMDEQLELLVAKWIHRAAPNAQGAANRQKFGR